MISPNYSLAHRSENQGPSFSSRARPVSLGGAGRAALSYRKGSFRVADRVALAAVTITTPAHKSSYNRA